MSGAGRLTFAAASMLLLVGGVLAFLSVSDGVTLDPDIVAATISTPPDWIDVDKESVKESDCLIRCDTSALITWESNKPPDLEELLLFAESNSWSEVEVSSICRQQPDLDRAQVYCSIEAIDSGRRVTVRASTLSQPSATYRIVVVVEPN